MKWYNKIEWLKRLGNAFHADPRNWTGLLSRDAGRLYIKVCKYYGYTKDQLSKLYDSLTMSLFLYGLKVWGSAYQSKHLDQIEGLFRRGYRFGYSNNLRSF